MGIWGISIPEVPLPGFLPGLAADKSTFLGKEELDPVTNFLIITITMKANTYQILFMSQVLGQSILYGTSHFLYPPIHEVQLSHFKVIY